MPSDNNHLNNEEIKLEILRIVVESGSTYQKEKPLPICENYYKWIKIPKKLQEWKKDT